MGNQRLGLRGKEDIGLPGFVSRLHPQLQLHQGTWRNDLIHVHLHFLNCNSEIIAILSCGVLGSEVNQSTGNCVEPKPAQALC